MPSELYHLQLIHNRLALLNHLKSGDKAYYLETNYAIRWLKESIGYASGVDLYQELINNISDLNVRTIPQEFIERFCISKIADKLLQTHPINVAEAFVISFLALNRSCTQLELEFRLGASGLLTPTIIDGVKVHDVDAISQFILRSLIGAKMIKITENKLVFLENSFDLPI